ncbi:hypothetical protein IWX47DRAFT_526629 [Phyllosticta citricarpa]
MLIKDSSHAVCNTDVCNSSSPVIPLKLRPRPILVQTNRNLKVEKTETYGQVVVTTLLASVLAFFTVDVDGAQRDLVEIVRRVDDIVAFGAPYAIENVVLCGVEIALVLLAGYLEVLVWVVDRVVRLRSDDAAEFEVVAIKWGGAGEEGNEEESEKSEAIHCGG